ncbi:cytochrome P450 [Pilobolus umbonatus]|nr:cytochrome P450 [Pilobolus umbonatus]
MGNSLLIGAALNLSSLLVTPITLLILLTTYAVTYYNRRYNSSVSYAPIAPAKNIWIKYFGMVPPPNDSETTDEISQFLIKTGRQARASSVSVCWSILGRPLVLVNTLQGVRDVLIDGQMNKVKGETTKIQRGDLLRLVQNLVFGGKNLNNTIGQDWSWRRHVLLPPFQPKQLVPNLLPFVATRTQELLGLFDENAKTGTALEVDGVFTDLTMDVINYSLYGTNDLKYSIVGGKSNLKLEHDKLGYGFQSIEVWLPFGISKTQWAQRSYKPSRDRLKEFISDSLEIALADYRRELSIYEAQGIPEKQRVFRSVAASCFASGKYGKDNFDLINDLLNLTFAGHDTTAHTLAFSFGELAQHPDIQEEIFAQVRSVLGPPPVRPESITPEKLARMPLVTAVYRETLRKYPAVVFISSHAKYDTMVDNVIIPAGSEVWSNVRGLQMNPDIFPNPEKFDLSRWIRPEDKVLKENQVDNAFDNLTSNSASSKDSAAITPETQYNFPDLSFALGKHACIGKNLAILELRTVIACTINQYTMTLKEGCVIDTKVVLTTRPRNGVWVNFHRR